MMLANKQAVPNYGIDAPGVVRANIILGCLFGSAAVLGAARPAPSSVPAWLCVGAAIVAGLLFSLTGVMLWSSLVGKKRVRDRVVAVLELSGDEYLLDAGCGSGLVLIGCAEKLCTGKAVGVDLWAAKDLSDNTPQATLANAAPQGLRTGSWSKPGTSPGCDLLTHRSTSSSQ